MESYVKVHPKHMVVIPKQVRDAAHIKIGDKLIAKFKKGDVVLTPVKEGDAEQRLAAIRRLRAIHPSEVTVPDKVLFDPLEYADPEDL